MAYAFRPGIPAWARDFDAWAADALSCFDVDALKDFQARAPAARTALPTWEHYAPVLVAAGAVADEQPHASFPITGFWMEGRSPSAQCGSGGSWRTGRARPVTKTLRLAARHAPLAQGRLLGRGSGRGPGFASDSAVARAEAGRATAEGPRGPA
jgi:hypothetical protein